MTQQVSRRELLGGAGAAIAAAGAAHIAFGKESSEGDAVPSSVSAAETPSIAWDDESDVVVIGSGTALAAAWTCASKGLKVIVLEKRSYLGGETSLSGGAIYAGGNTSIQQRDGIIDERTGQPDTVEQTIADIKAHGKTEYNENLLKKLVKRGPEMIDWLVSLGIEFSYVYQSGNDPIARGHAPTEALEKAGAAVTDPIVEDCRNYDCTFITSMYVDDIITDEDMNILGVRAIDADGAKHRYACKAVVLSGGTADNRALCMQFNPEALEWRNIGSGMNMGESFYLSSKFGARIMGTRNWLNSDTPVEILTAMGDSFRYDYVVGLGLSMMRGHQRPFIMINLEGQRFADETEAYTGGLGVAVAKQTDGHAYSIMDTNFFDDYAGTDSSWLDKWTMAGNNSLEDCVSSGIVLRADTLEELAEQLELDPSLVTGAVQSWNETVDAGVDDEFGRPADTFKRIENPPFFGWKDVPASSVPQNGAKISLDLDENCNVLNLNGQVIPGLYAVGLGTSMVPAIGHAYPGSGTGLGAGLCMGLVAGDAIVDYLGSQQ
jgi:hypothetical protein